MGSNPHISDHSSSALTLDHQFNFTKNNALFSWFLLISTPPPPPTHTHTTLSSLSSPPQKKQNKKTKKQTKKTKNSVFVPFFSNLCKEKSLPSKIKKRKAMSIKDHCSASLPCYLHLLCGMCQGMAAALFLFFYAHA